MDNQCPACNQTPCSAPLGTRTPSPDRDKRRQAYQYPVTDACMSTRQDIEASQLWHQYLDMGAPRYANRDRLIARFAIWRCAIRLGIDRLLQQEDKEGMIADDMRDYGQLIAPEALNPSSGGSVSPRKKRACHVGDVGPESFDLYDKLKAKMESEHVEIDETIIPEKTDKWHVGEALPGHFRDIRNTYTPLPEKTVNVTITSDLPFDHLATVLAQYFKQYGSPTLVFNQGDN